MVCEFGLLIFRNPHYPNNESAIGLAVTALGALALLRPLAERQLRRGPGDIHRWTGRKIQILSSLFLPKPARHSNESSPFHSSSITRRIFPSNWTFPLEPQPLPKRAFNSRTSHRPILHRNYGRILTQARRRRDEESSWLQIMEEEVSQDAHRV